MIINSKLKFILLILSGVFILLFSIFIYFCQKSITELKIQPDIQTGPLTAAEEVRLQEKIAGIIKTNDFNKCQEIENETYRTICVNNIALNLAEENQDISYCQKLDDELVSVASCERQVLLKKSLDKEDINICDETENSEIQKECRESFWPSLALKKTDINLCNNILAEQEKDSCRDNYLFKQEFVKSETSFICDRFNNQQVESDCKTYKENISLNKELTACDAFKSDLFLGHCLLKAGF